MEAKVKTESKTESKTDTFVFCRSFAEQYYELKTEVNEETAILFLEAILNYGLNDIVPENKKLKMYGIETIFKTIEASKKRYKTAKENGAKGGRPRIDIDMNAVHNMLDEGKTQNEIAQLLGTSTNTIGRRLKDEREGRLPNSQNESQNPVRDFESFID